MELLAILLSSCFEEYFEVSVSGHKVSVSAPVSVQVWSEGQSAASVRQEQAFRPGSQHCSVSNSYVNESAWNILVRKVYIISSLECIQHPESLTIFPTKKKKKIQGVLMTARVAEPLISLPG